MTTRLSGSDHRRTVGMPSQSSLWVASIDSSLLAPGCCTWQRVPRRYTRRAAAKKVTL